MKIDDTQWEQRPASTLRFKVVDGPACLHVLSEPCHATPTATDSLATYLAVRLGSALADSFSRCDVLRITMEPDRFASSPTVGFQLLVPDMTDELTRTPHLHPAIVFVRRLRQALVLPVLGLDASELPRRLSQQMRRLGYGGFQPSRLSDANTQLNPDHVDDALGTIARISLKHLLCPPEVWAATARTD